MQPAAHGAIGAGNAPRARTAQKVEFEKQPGLLIVLAHHVLPELIELLLRKRKLTAAYHICASSGMIPAPDEIGLMSISC